MSRKSPGTNRPSSIQSSSLMQQGRSIKRPTTILLVRHGSTMLTGTVAYGQMKGVSLSDAGRDEVVNSGAVLGTVKKQTAALYSSPLQRAKETAAIISKSTGLRVVTDRRLVEPDLGEWTGKKFVTLRRSREWSEMLRDRSSFRYPGGESFIEMQQRAIEFVEDVKVRHKGKVIVVVSHQAVIQSLLIDAMRIHLQFLEKIQIPTAAICVIEYALDGAVIKGVGVGQDLVRTLS